MSRRARRRGTDMLPAGDRPEIAGAGPGTPAIEVAVFTAALKELYPIPPLRCIGLGLLKDGRHVAFEAEVVGCEVRAWTALCALAQAEGPARAWWQVGFATLCAKRALLPAEVEANARDGHGVSASDFVDGAAVAIVGEGRTLTALAMRLEGTTVAEPAVIARGSREYCWSELAAWAALNMLPKRRRTS